MLGPTVVPSGVAALPASVAREVERRRVLLLASATEPVLDLHDPVARALVAAGGAGGEGRYATVVAAADLVAFPDLLAALRAVVRCLAPDGELRLVEPVQRPDALGVVLGTVWSSRPPVAGLHLQRDVAGTVRAAGLTVIEIERFKMPTSVWPLRHFAEVVARGYPAVPTAAAPAGEAVGRAR